MNRSALLLLVSLFVAAPVTAQSIAARQLVPETAVATAAHPASAAKSAIARHAELSKSLPELTYPVKAKEFGIEGMVKVAYTVDVRGRTRDAEVVESPGYDLDREALRAIRKARFAPAVGADGRPVAARYVTTFIFSLEGDL